MARGEAGTATQLKGWCWTRDVIKPGDSISMTGRAGSRTARRT